MAPPSLTLLRCAPEVGAHEVGVDEDGVHEDGAPEVGAPEVGTHEVRALEVGVREVRALEVGALEVGVHEVGALEVGVHEVGSPELGAPEVGAFEVGAPEIGLSQVDARQSRATKIQRTITSADLSPPKNRGSRTNVLARIDALFSCLPLIIRVCRSPLPGSLSSGRERSRMNAARTSKIVSLSFGESFAIRSSA